jgi:hypothetical protein
MLNGTLHIGQHSPIARQRFSNYQLVNKLPFWLGFCTITWHQFAKFHEANAGPPYDLERTSLRSHTVIRGLWYWWWLNEGLKIFTISIPKKSSSVQSDYRVETVKLRVRWIQSGWYVPRFFFWHTVNLAKPDHVSPTFVRANLHLPNAWDSVTDR